MRGAVDEGKNRFKASEVMTAPATTDVELVDSLPLASEFTPVALDGSIEVVLGEKVSDTTCWVADDCVLDPSGKRVTGTQIVLELKLFFDIALPQVQSESLVLLKLTESSNSLILGVEIVSHLVRAEFGRVFRIKIFFRGIW